MLLKICSANIDKTFRLNAELSLQKYYPVEFLKLAYTRRYYLDRFKWVDIVKTYQSFSYETLKEKILSGLRRGMYGEIDWICQALIRNEAKGKLTLKQLRDILSEFDRPVERMLLRRLRHYVHKCYFQEAK